jgi:hypothetical protein
VRCARQRPPQRSFMAMAKAVSASSMQLAGDDRDPAVEDAFEEGVARVVQRLGRQQRLDNEAGVQGDRVGQGQLLVLDREYAAGEASAPACRAHRRLPGSVHVACDADVDPKALGGTLQRRLLLRKGLRGCGYPKLG